MRSHGELQSRNLTASEWRGRSHPRPHHRRLYRSSTTGGELVQEGKLALVVISVIAIMVVLVVAARRLVPPHTLTLGEGLPAVVASRLFLAGSYFAMESYIPLMGQSFRGLSPTQSGLPRCVGIRHLGYCFLPAGETPDNLNRTKVLTFGMACGTVGILATLTLASASIPLAIAVIGWGIAGFGIGIAYPLAGVMVLALSQPGKIGNNSSSLSMAEQLGTSTSLALGGVLFGALVGGSMLHAILAFTAVPFSLQCVRYRAAARTNVGELTTPASETSAVSSNSTE
ncbi:MAG: hypothetical protein U1U88_000572 [Lawsonella clevelandensis]